MIYPTASEILRCVDHTLMEASHIDMPRMSVKSALATCRHMVRHVDQRLQIEQGLLVEDIAQVSRLLDAVADYLGAIGEAEAPLVGDIRATLADAPVPLLQGHVDDMDSVRRRALALREQLYTALRHLQSQGGERQATPAYRQVRTLIRDYIRWEIQQESKLVHPAFVGRGPRR